jgi:hypothetical protein
MAAGKKEGRRREREGEVGEGGGEREREKEAKTVIGRRNKLSETHSE